MCVLSILLLLLRIVVSERLYDIRIDGCHDRNVTLLELGEVLKSQERYWHRVGEREPFWSVLSSPDYASKRQLNLNDMTSFYQSGEDVINQILLDVAHVLKDSVVWFGGGLGNIALDFGCGVGRLSAALIHRFLSVVCIDHSQSHLDTMMTLNHRRILPLHSKFAGAEIEHFNQKEHGGADFAVSVLTLQHMIPELQAAAIEHLCDALAIGGAAYIQTLTFYTDAPYIAARCDPNRATLEPGMHLHYLPLDEIKRHLQLRSCSVLTHQLCDHFVSIPFRNSTSHCVVFVKTAIDGNVAYELLS